MDQLTTMTYAVDGRTARITLNRPRAATAAFPQAVKNRDEPIGDQGPSTYKG